MSTGLYFTSTDPKNAFQYAFVKQSCLVAPPSLHTQLQRSLGCTLPIDTPNLEVNHDFCGDSPNLLLAWIVGIAARISYTLPEPIAIILKRAQAKIVEIQNNPSSAEFLQLQEPSKNWVQNLKVENQKNKVFKQVSNLE